MRQAWIGGKQGIVRWNPAVRGEKTSHNGAPRKVATRIFPAAALTGFSQAQRHRTRNGSVLENLIAQGLPAMDEVLFLGATSPLPSIAIMGMEMRRAGRDRILRLHVTLQPLMQIPSLRNVDGNPTAVLGLPGIDVNAGQRFKSSLQGIDLVLVFLAGLPGPIPRGGRCVI
jgi:hypothetical protein